MLGVTTSQAGRGRPADWEAGSGIVRRSGQAAPALAARVPPPSLDYYLIYPQGPSTEPEGILVEEFVLTADYAAACLNSTGWTSSDRHWWNSSAFSRGVRVDADLRSRVAGVPRHEVELVYRRLGGGELPDEGTLRTYFRDGEPLATSAPLRLSRRQVAAGFHETRVYRILFANELGRDGLADLRATWQMTITGDFADPQARVIGTAHVRVGDDAFTWDLRRISLGAAWCLDLTANLAGDCADALGPLLRALTTVMRAQGLIPVTIERFS
jgi:hypothetical protein